MANGPPKLGSADGSAAKGTSEVAGASADTTPNAARGAGADGAETGTRGFVVAKGVAVAGIPKLKAGAASDDVAGVTQVALIVGSVAASKLNMLEDGLAVALIDGAELSPRPDDEGANAGVAPPPPLAFALGAIGCPEKDATLNGVAIDGAAAEGAAAPNRNGC